jgi:hypothetical protein
MIDRPFFAIAGFMGALATICAMAGCGAGENPEIVGAPPSVATSGPTPNALGGLPLIFSSPPAAESSPASVAPPSVTKPSGLPFPAVFPKPAPGDTSATPTPAPVPTPTPTPTPSRPSISGVSPNAGPLAGGQTVTIAGSNFTPDVTVSVGGAPATVTSESQTSLTITVPAAPGGTASRDDIVASEAAGSSPTSSSDLYQYEDVPTVSSVSPSLGPAAGGDTVTITGGSFYATDSVLTVWFGSVAASGAVVTSPTTITVTSPPGTALSTVDITVTDSGGTSAAAPPGDSYTYLS